jgi:threonine dehydrogenase-like Zn-dependent dehydrogenase
MQVRVHGPDDVRIDEVEKPEPGPRDAVIRVSACGICGSDLGYVRIGGLAGPTVDPMPLGHELSGVVARVGSEVEGLAPGTRVVLNPLGAGNQIGNGGGQGGFAPELLVPNAAAGGALFPIPDDLPDERAALAEPLGVGMQAVNRAEVSPGDRVVVFGAGPIGLMSLATLRHRGVEDVAVVDLSDARLAIARRLGAAATLNPSRENVWARLRDLHGNGSWLGMPMAAADAFIEASGAASVIPDIVANGKAGARLSIVALHRADIPISFMMVMAKQLTIAGSMAYPEDYTEMIDVLGVVDLTPAITHRFALEDFHQALAVAREPNSGAKVMIVG